MNYQQFLFTITSSIQAEYPSDRMLTVQTIENKHTGKIKTVSLYHSGKRETPLIYMAPFYRMYRSGYSAESICRELKNVLEMFSGCADPDEEVFLDFRKGGSFLTARLISYEKNRAFLELVPHRRILDLALMYQLNFQCSEHAMGAAVVYRDHCTLWGVTEEILFQTAISNMIRNYPASLDCLESLIPLPPRKEESRFPKLYVLTNSRGFFGASVLLYPGVLRSVCEKVGEAYYVLPSSVHEVLLLPGQEGIDVRQLKEIVEQVNQTEVASGEVLSDHVYHYCSARDQLTIEV